MQLSKLMIQKHDSLALAQAPRYCQMLLKCHPPSDPFHSKLKSILIVLPYPI